MSHLNSFHQRKTMRKKNDNVGYLSYVNDLCQDSGNPIVLPLCWCCWSLPFTVCCRNGAPTNACEILHQEGVVGHGKVSSHMVKQVDVIEFGWQPPFNVCFHFVACCRFLSRAYWSPFLEYEVAGVSINPG